MNNQARNSTKANADSLRAGAPILLWFRHDLRIDDNRALLSAAKSGSPVIPVFIWSQEEEGEWAYGGATCWWLHQSLLALAEELEGLGLRLIIRKGRSLEILKALLSETGAQSVLWNRRYEPEIIKRDAEIKAALKSTGIDVQSFNALLLFEPWEIKNGQGLPYKVYTPFSKTCFQKGVEAPEKAPKSVHAPSTWPKSMSVSELKLEPTIPWAEGMKAAWVPGFKGAMKELKRFLSGGITDYDEQRNIPCEIGTSRLSPYLHLGELSPRRIWAEIDSFESGKKATPGVDVYRKELLWREFAYHLLFHFPKTTTQPLRPDFKDFPWRRNKTRLRAWQKGQTGYPIVDAGMRELWTTGWMHNRVRMIVASFLIKDLLIPWQDGSRWFWDTLVDADLASNTLGWQWTAGCGADAAPFFRVFNPSGQGEKFDPRGEYVKKWCPELKKLPEKFIHRPWEAPPLILQAAGVQLGVNYPKPIVDHAEARNLALEAFESLPGRKIKES